MDSDAGQEHKVLKKEQEERKFRSQHICQNDQIQTFIPQLFSEN